MYRIKYKQLYVTTNLFIFIPLPTHINDTILRTCKIIINDTTIEQVPHYQYLRYDITDNSSNDVNKIIVQFNSVCGSISNTKKTWKEKCRWKSCILYGSENRASTQKHLTRRQVWKMKFLRYAKDRNKKIMEVIWDE